MKHDLFEFDPRMEWKDRAVRIIFLLILIGVLAYDLLVARPI